MTKIIKDPNENVLGRVIGLTGQAMKLLEDKNLAAAKFDLRLEHIILLRTILEMRGSISRK